MRRWAMRTSMSWLVLVALGLAACLAAWTAPVAAQEAIPPSPTVVLTPAPAAPEPVEETHTNWAVLAPGIAMLPAAYVLNLVVGLLGGVHVCIGPGSCLPPPPASWASFNAWSVVPVVGPWGQLAAFPEVLGDNPGWIAWLVAMGAIEAAGLVLIVVGIATPQPTRRRDSARGGVPRVDVLPAVGADGAGLRVLGSF